MLKKLGKIFSKILATSCAVAMFCSVSAGAVSSDVDTQERRIINKEIAPGVVLLDEGYDTDFGVYAFTKTYSVKMRAGLSVCFLPDVINKEHHDGVWIKLVDDASSGDSPVEFRVIENDRSSWGTAYHSHSVTLHEGGSKSVRLNDPVGCKFSIWAEFVSPDDNGTITVKVSCDDYETMPSK